MHIRTVHINWYARHGLVMHGMVMHIGLVTHRMVIRPLNKGWQSANADLDADLSS